MGSLLNQFTGRFRFNPLPIFFLLFMLVPVAPVRAEQWQNLNPRGYVNDFAGVLDLSTVEKLNAISIEVDQKAHAQIAVVTVKTLGDDPPEDFANHLFQKWGVGAKGTDRGVMFLLATDDHKYWTEVGYGLEGILPDGKVGTFGRSIVPILKQGSYDGAALIMVTQIAGVISQDSHVSLDSLDASSSSDSSPSDDYAKVQLRQFYTNLTRKQIICIVIAVIILLPLMFKFLGPWFLINLVLGILSEGSDNWGGGGFGGGGGGGGFGGGSSGGGGAGGSW